MLLSTDAYKVRYFTCYELLHDTYCKILRTFISYVLLQITYCYEKRTVTHYLFYKLRSITNYVLLKAT